MPRELALVSAEPVPLAALVTAGADVDGSLAVRALFDGWIVQLVDGADDAVLSIELSRRLDRLEDLQRTAPQLSGPVLTGPGPWWWTAATAPWGPVGETGLAVVRRLATLVGADLLVAEGR